MSAAQRAGVFACAVRTRSATARTSAGVLLVALAFTAALVAGCSSSGNPSPTSAPGTSTAATSPGGTGTGSSGGASAGKPAFCDAANKLKASVGALGSLSVSSGIAGLQTAIDNIQTSLNEFQAAAQSQFGPEVQQMRTALSDVQAAIRAAGASPSSSSITAIGTSAAAVVAAYTALQKAIATRCG